MSGRRPLGFTLRTVGKLWALYINEGFGDEIPIASGDLSRIGRIDEQLGYGNVIGGQEARYFARTIRLLYRGYGRLGESHSHLAKKVRGKTTSRRDGGRRTRKRPRTAAK